MAKMPGSGAKRTGANGRRLTPREIEVLHHVTRGLRNREIGALLAIKDGTVKSHLKRIFQKLGAGSRTEAAVAALRRGDLRL